ncbi:MAG: sugar ABC transporter substrate-binding protein [Pseudobutyrivibrio sp.]|nr:sugar ABC transporter substrate-binding protein [Pseudobutyrivibrio sp.]
MDISRHMIWSMYMHKLLKTISLISILILLFTACSSKEVSNLSQESEPVPQSATTYTGEDVKTIGISMPAAQLERWHIDADLLKTLFEDAGYNVLLSYGDNLIDAQINDINQMIDQGAQLLIISPVDSDSLGPCIENANKKNIPIVAYDRLIYHNPNLLAYVSYDNYMVGQLQAQYIVDALDLDNIDSDRCFNLEIFSGDSADNNAIYFYDGAMSILSSYINDGKLKVLSNQTSFYSTSISSWDTELACERMEIMLSSYYGTNQQLNAVLAANDSIALGVCEAIDSSYNKDNQIIITGQDCDSCNIQNIKDEKQSMSIYKNLNNEAYATFCIVQNYLNGVSTGDDLTKGYDLDFTIRRDSDTYVSDNVYITSYLLSPMVVTNANIDKVL